MLLFMVKRLLNIPIMFVLSTLLAFVIIQAGPGNPAELQAFGNDRYGQREVQRFIAEFGLDKPVSVQYIDWLSRALTGDLGRSLESKREVRDTMTQPVLNSLILATSSLLVVFVIATFVGVTSAVFENGLFDRFVNIASYIFLGLPSFFLAILFVLGILELGWSGLRILPISGMTSNNHDDLSLIGRFFDIAWHLVTPVLCIALSQVALYARLLRSQMIEFISDDFVRTAKAKGLSARAVYFKHALRNALIPFVAGIGGLLPAMLGGAGLIEVVFNYPGMTGVMLTALQVKDFFLFTGLISLSILILIVGNVIADVLLATIDPRIRYQ
jgi:peptide/nickel transport system permease protein